MKKTSVFAKLQVDKIEAPNSPPFPLQAALMSRVTALPKSIGPFALAASPAVSTASQTSKALFCSHRKVSKCRFH